jgi:C4-dicarboxylate transporter DctM subunit
MWWALFGSLFTLLFSGVWIGAALGLTGLIIMHFWGGGIHLLGGIAFEGINSYSLTALPAFIFMGQIIVESGLSKHIFENISPLMARLPGKLLQANVLLSGMFAAALGSSTANAAVVGSVSIPELRSRKYDERLVLGTVCVSGTLGLLIPPSLAFILYGVLADVSIAALFAAGTVPGIVMVAAFMAYIGIKGTITPSIAPEEEKGLPFKDTMLCLIKIWPLIIIILVCCGPIYIGWTTPTEAAGVGALGAVIMGRLFGKMNLQTIKNALVNTAEASATLFFLFIGAMILGASVSTIGAPRTVVDLVGGLSVSPTVLLMGIYLMYIIMGCFLDGISMQLVTLPFILPILDTIKVDRLWFGVIMVLLIEIGLVTPPVGLNLYVVQGIGGPGTSLSDIFWGSFHLLLVTIGVMLLLTFFPQIATFFPHAMGMY